MKDENFILSTLYDCEQVRIENCPELLFYVSGDTILATYDNSTNILFCMYEDLWEHVEHIPSIGTIIRDEYNKNTPFTNCVSVRPGVYQGNFLERNRFEGVWDWESVNEIPVYITSPKLSSPIDGDF